MKYLLAISMIVLSGCGEAGRCGDSPILGNFYNATIDDTISIKADCSFTNSSCASSGTVNSLTIKEEADTAIITITNGGSVGCLEEGVYTCDYTKNATGTLSFSCNDGIALTYTPI